MSKTYAIRLATTADIKQLYALVIATFEPIFASFKQVLGPTIYQQIYPSWQQTQRDEVDRELASDQIDFYVAVRDERIIGCVTVQLNHEHKNGEIVLLAVEPDAQNHGIGTELTEFALDKMRQAGMALAEVGTGGDPGHAQARRTYEKAGFTPLPLVRYYKKL